MNSVGKEVAFASFTSPLASWHKTVPCRSSRTKPATTMCTQSSSDLLVVGCGTLGGLLAKQWAKRGDRVVGATRTASRHDALRKIGVEPVLNDGSIVEKFPNVAFTAPPNGNPEYAAEVMRALERWDSQAGGGFVFTSSAGVYAEEGGALVTETGQVADRSEKGRAQVLLNAEDYVREVGGSVARLAGLYTLERGPHNFWMREGRAGGSADGLINMVHYSDAAALVASILDLDQEKAAGATFLAFDGNTLTRSDIIQAARLHPRYKDGGEVTFGVSDGGTKIGKRYDNSWTREVTGWSPQYPSMSEFFSQAAEDME